MPRRRSPAGLAIRLITDYQAQTSHPRMCAYDESCSDYALRQVREHGLIRGGWIAARRYRTCTAETAARLSATVAP